jgi:hypothetical protein
VASEATNITGRIWAIGHVQRRWNGPLL